LSLFVFIVGIYNLSAMLLFPLVTTGMGSRDNAVGIAAGYGLDGPGIETR